VTNIQGIRTLFYDISFFNTCSTLNLAKIEINFELNRTTMEFAREGNTSSLYRNEVHTERLEGLWCHAAYLYRSQQDLSCLTIHCSIRSLPTRKLYVITFMLHDVTSKVVLK
jgi:hypothetical protein